jgi:hypothetical protein
MPSPGWKLTVADVFSCSGGVPALASPKESAIEKHVACAAAISSSGLVRPDSSGSERDAQVTSSPEKAPLPVESIRPDPSISPVPRHLSMPVDRNRSSSFRDWAADSIEAEEAGPAAEDLGLPAVPSARSS